MITNLASKVNALAHLTCNADACFEAWLFALLA